MRLFLFVLIIHLFLLGTVNTKAEWDAVKYFQEKGDIAVDQGNLLLEMFANYRGHSDLMLLNKIVSCVYKIHNLATEVTTMSKLEDSKNYSSEAAKLGRFVKRKISELACVTLQSSADTLSRGSRSEKEIARQFYWEILSNYRGDDLKEYRTKAELGIKRLSNPGSKR